MNRALSIVYLFVVTACLSPGAALSATTAGGAGISAVMDQYFQALVSGDVETLKQVLGGRLLQKRSRLLNNPTYPGYLAKTYANATLQVVKVDTSRPDAATVDARIRFGSDDFIDRQYTLSKAPKGALPEYRITGEGSPEDGYDRRGPIRP